MTLKQRNVPRGWIAISAIVGLLLPAMAVAQQPARGRGPGPAVQRFNLYVERVKQALNELKITDDQKDKIQGFFDEAQERMRTLVPQLLNADQPTRRQQFVGVMDSLAEKIGSALNPDQLAEFKKQAAIIRREVDAAPAGPTTQPGQLPLPPRVVPAIERLNDFINQLSLNDQQRGQIQALFADMRKQAQVLRQQLQGDNAAIVEKMQPMIQHLREQLGDILTPVQLEDLRRLLNNAGPTPPGGRGGPMQGQAMQPDMMNGGGNVAAAAQVVEPDAPMVDLGKAAPEITLDRLDAQPVQLSAFKGKLVLLVFGSYSSPSMRQRAAGLEQLKHDYTGRASVFLIYTRENHPVGDWTVDRNKEDGVAVEQPTDRNGRQTIAKQLRSTYHLTVPIAIDSMDDAAAKAYGGETNAAYLIGRDGQIVARQRWFDPYAMRRLMDDAIKESPPKSDAAVH